MLQINYLGFNLILIIFVAFLFSSKREMNVF